MEGSTTLLEPRHIYDGCQKLDNNSCHQKLVEEVRGLPSDIHDETPPSGIIQKIQEGRRKRHDAFLSDVEKQLTTLNMDTDVRLQESLKSTLDTLETDFEVCNQLVASLDDDQDLMLLDWKNLHALWQTVDEHLTTRHHYIVQLEMKLSNLEDERALKTTSVFNDCSKNLIDIAYLLTEDVEELIKKKCSEVNEHGLSSRHSHAVLVVQLQICSLKRQMNYHESHKKAVARWRDLKINSLSENFREFVSSNKRDCIIERETILAELVAAQTNLNEKRRNAADQLRQMKPPSSTKTSVYQWYNALTTLMDELELASSIRCQRVTDCHKKFITKCQDEALNVQFNLHDQSIMDKEETREFFKTHQELLITTMRAEFDDEEELMKDRLQKCTSQQKDILKTLFEFAQTVAHVWDCHELELANIERRLDEKLTSARREHDGMNKLRETKLDIVIDKLRQESSEEDLSATLNDCLAHLDEIKECYYEFYQHQLKLVNMYPKDVDVEMKRYDEMICRVFKVCRMKSNKEGQQQTSTSDNGSKDDNVDDSIIQSPDVAAVDRYVTTNDGGMFLIIDEPDEDDNLDGTQTAMTMKTELTFLSSTQDDDYHTIPYLASMMLPNTYIEDLKRFVRQQFINHLDDWKMQLADEADFHVQSKVEELGNELDLRLHLHEPRPQRIQLNVHDVRAAELSLHKNRTQQHCQAVVSSLSKLKTKFQEVMLHHAKKTSQLKQSIEKHGNEFLEAKNTHQLLKIQDGVSKQLEKYVDEISSTLRTYRKDFENEIDSLRLSNTTFKKSLKMFSDGGNFSAAEVDEYRKKLDRVTGKMEHTEGSLMAELEAIETQRLEAANDFVAKLTERFKHHLLDLTFMEKMQRWFGNIQMQIKGEVNKCNIQTQSLAQQIAALDRRIDAILSPNMDKEVVPASKIHNDMTSLVVLLRERVAFLECSRDSAKPERQIVESRSSPDKSPTKKKQRGDKKTRSNVTKREESNTGRGTIPVDDMTTTGHHGSLSNIKSSSHKIINRQSSTGIHRSNDSRLSSESRLNLKESTSRDPDRFDKYLINFDTFTANEGSFAALIKLLVKDGLGNLLAVAEMYYRHKGNRLPTRTQEIHESFEQCADALVDRMQSYGTQVDEYHNTCILELQAQVRKFNAIIIKIPQLLFDEIKNSHDNRVKKQRDIVEADYHPIMKELDELKSLHYSCLRPTLGHPQNENELKRLCGEASERAAEAKRASTEYFSALKGYELAAIEEAIGNLRQLTVDLLREADGVLTAEDIIVRVQKQVHRSERQLLRARLQESGRKEVVLEKSLAESIEWPALASSLALMQGSEQLSNDQAIQSIKSTPYHECIIEGRNAVFKILAESCDCRLTYLQSWKDKYNLEESRWHENWEKSVEKITSFY